MKKDETSTALLKRLTNNNKLSVEQTNYGVTARALAKIEGASQPARVSAITLDDKQVLFLAGTSTKEQFSDTDRQLLTINKSFTRLSDKQIKNIKPPSLKIIEVKAGDKFASLANQSAIDRDAENILRLLNRAFPDGSITASQKIKVIEFNK